MYYTTLYVFCAVFCGYVLLINYSEHTIKFSLPKSCMYLDEEYRGSSTDSVNISPGFAVTDQDKNTVAQKSMMSKSVSEGLEYFKASMPLLYAVYREALMKTLSAENAIYKQKRKSDPYANGGFRFPPAVKKWFLEEHPKKNNTRVLVITGPCIAGSDVMIKTEFPDAVHMGVNTDNVGSLDSLMFSDTQLVVIQNSNVFVRDLLEKDRNKFFAGKGSVICTSDDRCFPVTWSTIILSTEMPLIAGSVMNSHYFWKENAVFVHVPMW
jgi:hypothetical protein